MYYQKVLGENLSALGLGTMRLPKNEAGGPDESAVFEMVDYAIAHGINYFDTAYPYMNGQSEIVIGKALSRYPRDSYYLATKYPGHQMVSEYRPEEVFEDQLKKCGVDYFDFYLLHNVYENDIEVYESEKWGILPYFLEQKRKGRIRHLGFSSHARPDCLNQFLDRHGEEMEFILMETNYLDWTLQHAGEKYESLTKRGIPVFVMEPLRGGRLVRLPETEKEKLAAIHPDWSTTAWAFRFLQSRPNLKVILSGMSDLEQMKENVALFEKAEILGEKEQQALMEVAETLKNALPCTGCRYCVAGCPMGLDIPRLIDLCNEVRYGLQGSLNASMALEAIPKDHQHDACIGCGACAAVCPQGIDIPGEFRKMAEVLPTIPSWADICREREAIAKAMRAKKG